MHHRALLLLDDDWLRALVYDDRAIAPITATVRTPVVTPVVTPFRTSIVTTDLDPCALRLDGGAREESDACEREREDEGRADDHTSKVRSEARQ